MWRFWSSYLFSSFCTLFFCFWKKTSWAVLLRKCTLPRMKPHFLFHVMDSMATWAVNLSCFSTERKHRQSKGIGSFAFRQWTDTMLRRNLGSLLDYARSTEGFAPYALDDPRPFDAPRLARQQIEGDRSLLLAH